MTHLEQNVQKFLELFPKSSITKDGKRIVFYRGFWFRLYRLDYLNRTDFGLICVKQPKNVPKTYFNLRLDDLRGALEEEILAVFEKFKKRFEKSVFQDKMGKCLADIQNNQSKILSLEKYNKKLEERMKKLSAGLNEFQNFTD